MIRRAKRLVAPMVANRWVGSAAAFVLRNRIPHRGLTIDTSSPMIAAQTKAVLLFGGYETPEQVFVRRYLPRDCDAIELGGSIGVVSCAIRKKLAPARRLIVVEADARLADQVRTNLELNDCAAHTEVLVGAISYAGDTVEFFQGATTLSGHLADAGLGETGTLVPTIGLGHILGTRGITDYALVMDIEGAEWDIYHAEPETLFGARVIIAEVHGRPGPRSPESFVERLTEGGRFALVDQVGAVVVLERRDN